MRLEESLTEVLICTSERLADRFYKRLFERNPKFRDYFHGVNMKHQAAMFTMGLQVMVQQHCTPSRSTRDYLQVIGYKHDNRGIKEEDYSRFIDTLLATLEEFHGPEWNDELSDEWRTACQGAIALMLSGASNV